MAQDKHNNNRDKQFIGLTDGMAYSRAWLYSALWEACIQERTDPGGVVLC